MSARTLRFSSRIGAAIAGAALLFGAGAAVTAEQASSLEPRTVYFADLAKCNAGKGIYSGSFTRITQDCTYSGSYLFGVKTSSGPYFIVYTTR